jgi:hypothetical protein
VVTKVLREPLVHFLALALAIFMLYGALNRSVSVTPGRIVVTQARIEHIATLFARTWQRPPSASELKGLIDDYVKDEVYYREALKLGLEADDTVIRRRLRQKMEFLSDAANEILNPTERELAEYLNAHAEEFFVEPAIAFRQIYLNSERRGDKTNEDAKAALEALRSNSSLDPASVGDTTLLPFELPLTSKTSVSQTFGPAFAEEITKSAPGNWVGPIKSAFGVHLVRVQEISPGRAPTLVEVREAVQRDWASEKRRTLAERRFDELLQQYDVTFESVPKAAAQAPSSP